MEKSDSDKKTFVLHTTLNQPTDNEEPSNLDIDPKLSSFARLWNVARILNPENPSPPSILPSDLL